MAKGSANREGDSGTHGEPLSPEEIVATKQKLGLPSDKSFWCPDEALAAFGERQPALRKMAATWKAGLDAKLANEPEFRAAWGWSTRERSSLTFEWPAFEAGKKLATRQVV